MLLLNRSPGETIHIGDDVVVHVHSVKGGQVVVGVMAPRDRRVVRGELLRENSPAPPKTRNGR